MALLTNPFNSRSGTKRGDDRAAWAEAVAAQINVLTGTTAPASTPAAVGRMYVDTTAAKVYISTGTATSADWKILN